MSSYAMTKTGVGKSVRARRVSKKRKLVKRLTKKKKFLGTPGTGRNHRFLWTLRSAREQLVGRNVPELKYYDRKIVQGLTAVGPFGLMLTNMSQGAGPTQRVGRLATMVSLQYAISVLSVDPLFSQDSVVVYFVLDRQCNGVGTQYADVFDNTDVIGNGFRIVANAERFRVLRKVQLFPRNMTSITATSCQTYDNVCGFIDLGSIPLEYNGATGNTAELRSNAINVFYGCQTSVNQLTATIHIRFRFLDV